MKRRLFIGSSKEGLKIAQLVKEQIIKQLSDFIIPELWQDGDIFTMNKSALDSLIRASRRFDYGILVATKDDKLLSRWKGHSVPRDNVIFEMGMFLGSLGLTRAFLLVEENAKLPTDYNGITRAVFSKRKKNLEKKIAEIIEVIKKTKQSYNLRPMPSAALALGHFDNFIERVAKEKLNSEPKSTMTILIPNDISDIPFVIKKYKLDYPSKEIQIYETEKRPSVFKYIDDENRYWDIPTNLSTIYRLINLVHPPTEIGVDVELREWLAHEVRNYKGTLEALIDLSPACRGNVTVEYLDTI
jgi:hypothetical protein